jgi:murein DD-endopeptidase MepM/ murein hydrolase activator NlpD
MPVTLRTDSGGRRWSAVAVLVAVTFVGCAPARPAPPSAPPASTLAEFLSGFAWPVPVRLNGDVSSPFGTRGRRHHDGLDLRARHGDPIFAARDGVVRFAGTMRGYGMTVIVDHGGGVSSLYAHASAIYVRAGERVERGAVIGAVGATGNATGPHLHFEISWAGRPMDPVPLLPRLTRPAGTRTR